MHCADLKPVSWVWWQPSAAQVSAVQGLASSQFAGTQGLGGSVLVEVLDVEVLVDVLDEVVLVLCVVEVLELVLDEVLVVVWVVLVEVLLVVAGAVEDVERVVEVLVDVLEVLGAVLAVEEVVVVTVVVVEQAASGVWMQVRSGSSQLSVVQGFPSSQLRRVPWQMPA
jgi:hypothetical protein